jgi:hypothetical protein
LRPTIPARTFRARLLPSLATRLATLSGIPVLLALTACSPEPAPPENFKPNTGQIQVLNGSGRPGQADVFRTHLIERGFDVIEFGNARSWNYDHTLVLARTLSDTIARDLARVLGTRRVVHLQHPASLVEATVIIGKDYKELMRTWSQTEKIQP